MRRRWGFSRRARRGRAGAPAATRTASPSPAFDAAATVADAAHKLGVERAGVVALHRHIAAQQHGPVTTAGSTNSRASSAKVTPWLPFASTSRSVAGPPAAISAKAQAGADKYLPDDEYQLPLREDRLADYRSKPPRATAVPPGTLRSASRASNETKPTATAVAIVDTAAHHFVRIDFVPSVLPKYVDKASISIVFGRALRDLWDELELDQHSRDTCSSSAEVPTSRRRLQARNSPSLQIARRTGLEALDSGVPGSLHVPTRQERYRHGKSLRRTTPRSDQAV